MADSKGGEKASGEKAKGEKAERANEKASGEKAKREKAERARAHNDSIVGGIRRRFEHMLRGVGGQGVQLSSVDARAIEQYVLRMTRQAIDRVRSWKVGHSATQRFTADDARGVLADLGRSTQGSYDTQGHELALTQHAMVYVSAYHKSWMAREENEEQTIELKGTFKGERRRPGVRMEKRAGGTLPWRRLLRFWGFKSEQYDHQHQSISTDAAVILCAIAEALVYFLLQAAVTSLDTENGRRPRTKQSGRLMGRHFQQAVKDMTGEHVSVIGGIASSTLPIQFLMAREGYAIKGATGGVRQRRRARDGGKPTPKKYHGTKSQPETYVRKRIPSWKGHTSTGRLRPVVRGGRRL